MSMPLAMLTLGLHPKYVIDICVNILDPIAKALAGNRLLKSIKTDVRKLIIDNYKVNADTDSDLIQLHKKETRDSLLAVYDFALELRTITSFFKVNQGVVGQYVELLNFYKNLANSGKKIVKQKNIRTINPLNPVQNTLDLSKLFMTPELKIGENVLVLQAQKEQALKETIAGFEEIKTGVNIFDVVNKNNNFRSMLESVELTMETLRYLAGAAAFVEVSELEDVDMDTNKYRKLIRIYLDFIIGKALQSPKMKDLRFSPKQLQESLSTTLNIETGINDTFSLTNTRGVNDFITIMNTYVIPRIIANNPNNFFCRSLVEKVNKQTGIDKNLWTIDYDVFNDEDTAEQQNIVNATRAFKEISNLSSGLKTVLGQEITIGDALYLYDVIAYKAQMSGLHTVVDNTANETSSKFAEIIRLTYINYDHKARLDKAALAEEFKQLNSIQHAILNGTYEALDDQNRTLRLQGTYIWSFAETEAARSIKEIEQAFNCTAKTLLSADGESYILWFEDNNVINNNRAYSSSEQIGSDLNKPLSANTVKRIQESLQRKRDELTRTTQEDGSVKLTHQQIKDLFKHSELETIIEAIFNDASFKDFNMYEIQGLKEISLLPITNGYISEDNSSVSGKRIYLSTDYFNKSGENTTFANSVSLYEILDLIMRTQSESETTQDKVLLLDLILSAYDWTTLTNNAGTLTNPYVITLETKKAIINKYLIYLLDYYPNLDLIQYAISVNRLLSDYPEEVYYSHDRIFIEPENKQIGSEFIKVYPKANVVLELGDKVTFSNDKATGLKNIIHKDVYTYQGEFNDRLIFQNINGEFHTLPKDSDINNIQIIGKLRVPVGYQIDTRWEESNFEELPLTDTRKEGDIITVNNTDLQIKHIIYDNNDLAKEVWFVVDKLGNIQAIDKPRIESMNITAVRGLKVESSISVNDRLFIFEITPNTKYILNRLRSGDTLVVNNNGEQQEVIFQRRLDNTMFRARLNNQYIDLPYTSIKSVGTSNNFMYDRKFEHNVKPLTLSKGFEEGNATLTSLHASFSSRLGQGVHIAGQDTGRKQIFFTKNGSSDNDYYDGDIIYNMYGYYQIPNGILNPGDICIKRDQDRDYIYLIKAKLGIGDSADYEVLVKTVTHPTKTNLSKVLKTEYLTLKHLYVKGLLQKVFNDPSFEYYTSNKFKALALSTTIIDNSQQALTKKADLLSLPFIQTLKNTYGINVEFSTNLQTNAKFENNTILLNSNMLSASNEDLLLKSVHEFSHLALMTLRIVDPDGYLSLMSKLKFTDDFRQEYTRLISNTENISNYQTNLDILEEVAVKLIENSILDRVSTSDSLDSIMNKAFNVLFGIVEDYSLKSSQSQNLANLLKDKQKTTSRIVPKINLLELQMRNTITDKVLNDTLEICK